MSRFEIVRQLGEGGMAKVYLARDRAHGGREVALKRMTDRYVGRPEREQRLTNEARYLKVLSDVPGVVRYFDSGRDEHGPWLAMERMHGKPIRLAQALGGWDSGRVVELAHQLARTLVAIHERGVVHRDITPSNVFLLEDRHVKVFDFGHAAELTPEPTAERLTQVFEVPGTAGFMSPEQVRNFPPMAAMDVYAFGALLYELVTRHAAFEGYTDRSKFIEDQRGDLSPPAKIKAWAYDVPEELAQLVDECLRRDVAERPTMSEIASRLGALLEPSETSSAPPVVATPVPPQRGAVGGRAWIPMGVALLVVLAAAGGVLRASADEAAPARDHLGVDDEPEAVTAALPDAGSPDPVLADLADEPITPDLPYESPPDLPSMNAAPVAPREPKLSPKSPECAEPRAQVEAATTEWQWQRILDLTQQRGCWRTQERIALRTRAHFERGEWAACVKAGERGRSSEVQRFVEHCEKNL